MLLHKSAIGNGMMDIEHKSQDVREECAKTTQLATRQQSKTEEMIVI